MGELLYIFTEQDREMYTTNKDLLENFDCIDHNIHSGILIKSDNINDKDIYEVVFNKGSRFNGDKRLFITLSDDISNHTFNYDEWEHIINVVFNHIKRGGCYKRGFELHTNNDNNLWQNATLFYADFNCHDISSCDEEYHFKLNYIELYTN